MDCEVLLDIARLHGEKSFVNGVVAAAASVPTIDVFWFSFGGEIMLVGGGILAGRDKSSVATAGIAAGFAVGARDGAGFAVGFAVGAGFAVGFAAGAGSGAGSDCIKGLTSSSSLISLFIS